MLGHLWAKFMCLDDERFKEHCELVWETATHVPKFFFIKLIIILTEIKNDKADKGGAKKQLVSVEKENRIATATELFTHVNTSCSKPLSTITSSGEAPKLPVSGSCWSVKVEQRPLTVLFDVYEAKTRRFAGPSVIVAICKSKQQWHLRVWDPTPASIQWQPHCLWKASKTSLCGIHSVCWELTSLSACQLKVPSKVNKHMREDVMPVPVR